MEWPPSGQRRGKTSWRRHQLGIIQRGGIFAAFFAVMMLLLSLMLSTVLWPAANSMLQGRLTQGYRAIPNPHPGLVHTGLLQWEGVTQTTAPSVPVAAPTAGIEVDPAFASYYRQHGGASQLGTPLTPAFESSDGLMQFFTNTALIQMPSMPQGIRGDTTANSGPLGELISAGIHDPQSGIVELPLLHSLLTAGSLATLGGSSITYADLRAAADPSRRVVENAGVTSQNWVFVPEAAAGKKFAGHCVPVALWRFINEPSVAPDGWLTDVGEPLTEALPITVTGSDGTVHHEVVQAFWQTAFVIDEDRLDANGNPVIQRLSLGHDYLATLGYPAASVAPGTSAWVAAAATITLAPAGSAVAHLGTRWPVTLNGPTLWIKGKLWYSVTWQTGNRTGLQGWLLAATLTSTAPPAGAAGRGVTSIDALSPVLASYLAQLDGDAGVAIST